MTIQLTQAAAAAVQTPAGILLLLLGLAIVFGVGILLAYMFRRKGAPAFIAGIITAAVVMGAVAVVANLSSMRSNSPARSSSPAPAAEVAAAPLKNRASQTAPTSVAPPLAPDHRPLAAQPTLPATPPPSSPHTTRWVSAADLMPDAVADLHPSRQEAEDALAAQLAERYTPLKPIGLSLIDKSVRFPDQTYGDLIRAILHRGLVSSFSYAPPDPSIAHTNIRVNLSLTLPTDSDPIGTLTAKVANSPDLQVRFINKPWLPQLTRRRYATQNPDLTVVLHEGLELSESQAHTAALRAAADLIAPRLAGLRPGMPTHPYGPALDDVLQNTWTPHDRFTQRIDHPVRPAYRTALLVNLTPTSMQQLALAVDRWSDAPPTQPQTSVQTAHRTVGVSLTQTSTTHASILFRVLSLGAMVGLTLLIYHALDRWTRGQRPVTTTTLVLLGAAALLGVLFIA